MLASFLFRPKIIIGAALLALVFGAAWHYRSVIADRAELLSKNVALALQVDALEVALHDERAAVERVTRQRQSAQAALDALRAGRAGDEESVRWGAQAVPQGERGRLCAAMPWLAGCGEAEE